MSSTAKRPRGAGLPSAASMRTFPPKLFATYTNDRTPKAKLSHQLLLQQEAGHGGLQELGHTLGGGVGAVGSAERVVHVQVGVGGQLCVLYGGGEAGRREGRVGRVSQQTWQGAGD